MTQSSVRFQIIMTRDLRIVFQEEYFFMKAYKMFT